MILDYSNVDHEYIDNYVSGAVGSYLSIPTHTGFVCRNCGTRIGLLIGTNQCPQCGTPVR